MFRPSPCLPPLTLHRVNGEGVGSQTGLPPLHSRCRDYIFGSVASSVIESPTVVPPSDAGASGVIASA